MYHVPKDPAANEECSVVCMQAPSKDFVQEGANLGRAHGSPYQKLEIPWIWPTIFDMPCNFILFLQLFYFSSVFPSGGGTFHPLWLRPCSRAYQVWENSLRNDTGAKYTKFTMDPEKNCRLGLRFMHNMAARCPPERSELFPCSESDKSLCWLLGTLLVTRPQS